MDRFIQTVQGPIPAEEMGITLPHEHVIVDFIGAKKTGPHRYSRDHVVEVMGPFLSALKEQGVETFVDCSPMYLARDPLVLLRLSRNTGLNILTNTGQYKEPFLPDRTFEIDSQELAESWIDEWENGIGETDVRPGFIKTAVHPEPLGAVQEKVIRAGALTMKATGLPMATHTGFAQRAMDIVAILEDEEVDPGRWIFVHAQNEPEFKRLLEVAKKGVWIELDGIGENSVEKHLIPLLELLNLGFENQILLSQDAGWYRVGEEPGGKKKPYTFLIQSFLPLLKSKGIDGETIDKLMRVNPARAFAVAASESDAF